MAKHNLDLTGVHPTRWAEVRRRIDVIEAYLALPDPSYVVEAQYAESLGMGPPHFRKLISIWKNTRDPAQLPGALLHNSQANSASDQIDPKVREIIADTTASASSNATAASLWRSVDAQCRQAGLKTPSSNLVWRWAARLRPKSLPNDAAICVDYCLIKLQVEGIVELPTLGLVMTSDGHVLGHDVSFDPPSARRSTDLVIAALDSGGGERIDANLLMSRSRGPDWQLLTKAINKAGITISGATRNPIPLAAGIPCAIGHQLGPLDLRFSRPTSTKPLQKERRRAWPPISANDLPKAVEQAVATHNSSYGDRPNVSLLDADQSRLLSSALRGLRLLMPVA